MDRAPSISESEWKVMKVVWSNPPRTLQHILSSLEYTGWSMTTIQTYLSRLVKKGVLHTERQGKGYLYYPSLSEEECQTLENTSFLNRVYDGSLSKMIMGFTKGSKLTDRELQSLKALIDEQEQEQK